MQFTQVTQFITDHWQLVFGGVGTAVVAAIVGAWARSFFGKPSGVSQKIKSGQQSTNVQSARDANVNIPPKQK